MTHLEKFLIATPVVDDRPVRIRRAALLGLGVFFLIAIVSIAALAVSRGADGEAADGATTSGAVVDGWMTSIGVAQRAASEASMLDEAARARDGWSSALLRPEPKTVDGWASSLLKPEPEVVDGWSVRYLVSDGD